MANPTKKKHFRNRLKFLQSSRILSLRGGKVLPSVFAQSQRCLFATQRLSAFPEDPRNLNSTNLDTFYCNSIKGDNSNQRTPY